MKTTIKVELTRDEAWAVVRAITVAHRDTEFREQYPAESNPSTWAQSRIHRLLDDLIRSERGK